MNSTSTIQSTARRLVLAAAAVAFLAPAAPAMAGGGWAMGEKVQGNGNIKKQQREVGHFTGVNMGLPGNAEVRLGNNESISIETDENLLPLIEAVIEDGVLRVRTTKKNLNLVPKSLHVVVYAKELNRVELGGSGSIDADAFKATRAEVALGGSGSINIKGVDSDRLSVTIGGSGNLKIGTGSTDKLSITIGGSGDVNVGGVKANDVNVTVGGSGQSIVWAKDSLSFTIAGSGDVNYYGDPKVSKTVFGSGGTKRLGAAPR